MLILPADVHFGQAVLGDTIVDEARSSLLLHIHRGYVPPDDQDEEDEEEEEDPSTISTITLANLIPGKVRHSTASMTGS